MGTTADIARLREGSMVDYDTRTWTVTEHERHDDTGWPDHVWTLKSGADARYLEYEHEDGDVFRLSTPATISEIVSEDSQGERRPFLAAIRDSPSSLLGAPSTILYQREEYLLAEEDARVHAEKERNQEKTLTRSDDNSVIGGVCGGFAEYMEWNPHTLRAWIIVIAVLVPPLLPLLVLGYFSASALLPPPSPASPADRLTHYWVYEKDDAFVVLECHGANDWDAYAGREVAPHEFDDVLPASD